MPLRWSLVRRLLGALGVVAAMTAPAARATEMIHLDTKTLVQGSADIVVGKVESITPHWNSAHTKIFTDVSVRVTETLKGRGGDPLVLTQIGGEVDGVRYTVPGCPAFVRDEEALLFVWRDRLGRAQVNGLGQGKFDIRRDPATGEATVQRAVPGLGVSDARLLRLVPQGQAIPRIPLNDLLREIRRELGTGGGR